MFGVGTMKALVMSLAVLSLSSSSSSVMAARTKAAAVHATPSLVSNSNSKTDLSAKTKQKLQEGKRLNLRERKQVRTAEKEKYVELRRQGVDEVSNTPEAAALRAYKLRAKKRKGLLRKRQATLADVLFPGVAPVEYNANEPVYILADLVESRKTPIPFEYYDLPVCTPLKEDSKNRKHKERKNLGSRLQGHSLQTAPFSSIRVKRNLGCTPTCSVVLSPKKLRWMRQLVDRQYRVQLQLDQLPVLMRSKEYNYAVRGYPVGFKAPASFQALKAGEFYLFNHLKFVITYHEDSVNFQGVRVTGFDVHPVSIQHEIPKDGKAINENTELSTCNGSPVDNDPSKYLALRGNGSDNGLPITYSYEVEWVASDLPWTDRWDVYLVGAPNDDLHYFSILNSLVIVLFLTGAISTIMIRTLRKDIAVYNEMDSLEEGGEETGWKLVHGDVFRPPQNMPMLLSVLVGTGCQIGLAFGMSMLAAILKLLNPLQKGQTLTALIILYVLCGSVAGYVSARIYKFTDQTKWKLNIILTAVGLPGCLVSVFTVLNIFLSFAGAATAVSFLTMIALFLLWVCVSAPLVFIGAFFGLKAEKFEIPTKTNQIARVVPPGSWHVLPRATILMGGILPFGSVCIELAFIMSALWLHQIYYVMGFLLVVLLILAATCAQVAIVLTYLQLCAEDHRWWWMSFFNCASAGFYLFLYSLWFLSSRLDMVGLLPVVVYLTYMGMISICFGIFCGSVGFMSSLWFTRTIYGAVKVD
jgi:transmembrane 9 superfamily protein 2/4